MLLNREQREQLRQMGSLSTIGLELGLSIALGYLGGEWLDGKLGTEPLYRVVRRAQRMMEDEDENP